MDEDVMYQNHISKMTKNDYDFPVEILPIIVNEKEIPRRKAIVRTDTNDVLGIVSDRYKLLPYPEAISLIEESLRTNHVTCEKVRHIVTNNGADLYSIYHLAGMDINVQVDDPLSPYVIFCNSYDGQSSLQIIFGFYRLICSNGLLIGHRHRKYSLVHFDRHNFFPSLVINIQKVIKDYVKFSIPVLTKMVQTPLSRNDAFKYTARLKKKKRYPIWFLDGVEHNFDKEQQTVWGFYNALTYVCTHGIGEHNFARQVDYAQKAWSDAKFLMSQ